MNEFQRKMKAAIAKHHKQQRQRRGGRSGDASTPRIGPGMVRRAPDLGHGEREERGDGDGDGDERAEGDRPLASPGDGAGGDGPWHD
jgi:hypothetical protein